MKNRPIYYLSSSYWILYWILDISPPANTAKPSQVASMAQRQMIPAKQHHDTQGTGWVTFSFPALQTREQTVKLSG